MLEHGQNPGRRLIFFKDDWKDETFGQFEISNAYPFLVSAFKALNERARLRARVWINRFAESVFVVHPPRVI